MTRTFIINTKMENKKKGLLIFRFFSGIMAADHRIYDHDLRKDIEIF